MSDADAVEAAADKLVRRYGRAVPPPHDRDDLRQVARARMAVALAAPGVRDRDGYLYAAGRNAVLTFLTRARRRHARLPTVTGYCLNGFAARERVPAVEIEESCAAILATLKPRARRLFVARFIDGATLAEVAAETGRDYRSVENAIYAARARVLRHFHRLRPAKGGV